MKYPNLNEEKKLWKKGFKYVVGVDEAGRGPLAGPVVAAAVFVKPKTKILIKGINDSKKLSEKQREEFYEILTIHPHIKWGIGVVSEKVIDKINILEATKLAMNKAVKNLQKKLAKEKLIRRTSFPIVDDRQSLGKVDFLILDGNFKINSACLPAGRQKSIVKGDQKVISIAAASIIAKVTRDRLMRKYHKKYPEYGFCFHKGYPTKAHFANLKKFGPCKIHRKSFWPVKAYAPSTNFSQFEKN
ncbi:MAG: ribonuclease HII [bacterium]